jgi:uncharacterized membrane protein YgaE (UPF0421/DUF939 family)
VAQLNNENSFSSSSGYARTYLAMRKAQFEVLERMGGLLTDVTMMPKTLELVSELTKKIALEIAEENDGKMALSELERVLWHCRKEALPASREEFESRAYLFQYLSELRQFIMKKQQFMEE